MNPIELTAAALGVVNVLLVVRRSLWNYPFGIAMVALYFFVFAGERLYSDALLQVFFLVLQLYGWWNWRQSRARDDEVVIERLTLRARSIWGVAIVVAALGWGSAMARFTDAVVPYADATVAAMSIAAQILQSRRKVESWVLWIAVDMLAIGLFWSRELYATAWLYLLFLLLSVAGWRAWRASMGARVQGDAPAVMAQGATGG